MNPQPVRSAARAFNPGTYPPGGGFGVELGVGVGPPGAGRARTPRSGTRGTAAPLEQ
jgi:hypothetical protein